MSACVPRRLKRRQRAVREPRQEHAGVVDRHRSDFAGQRVGAGLDEGFGHRRHLVNLSVQPHGGVDIVRQQVARDAGPGNRRIQTPQPCAALRKIGGNRPILQEDGAVVEDSSQPAFVDQLLGQGDRRGAPVVVPDHVRDSGGFHRRRHCLGFARIPSQRLLAHDDLASFGGGNGDFIMGVVGAGDVDQVDIGGFNHLAPVGGDVFVSPLGCKGLRLVGIAGANGLQDRLIRQVEKVGGLAEGVRVGTAHEAVADHSYVQFLLHWS